MFIHLKDSKTIHYLTRYRVQENIYFDHKRS